MFINQVWLFLTIKCQNSTLKNLWFKTRNKARSKSRERRSRAKSVQEDPVLCTPSRRKFRKTINHKNLLPTKPKIMEPKITQSGKVKPVKSKQSKNAEEFLKPPVLTKIPRLNPPNLNTKPMMLKIPAPAKKVTKTKSRAGSKMSKSALRDTNENKILVESRNQSNRFKPDQPKNRRQSLRFLRSRSRARSKNSSIDFDKNLEPDFASPIKISKPSRVDRRQTCANMNRSQIFCQSILGGLKTKSSFLETTQHRRRISTAFFTKAIQGLWWYNTLIQKVKFK